MNHINRPIAIRMEFMGFDDASARGLSGTERAARSLLRRRLAGAKASRTNNMTKLSFASAGPCSSSRHESCPA